MKKSPGSTYKPWGVGRIQVSGRMRMVISELRATWSEGARVASPGDHPM
jgi:hypothetical protein